MSKYPHIEVSYRDDVAVLRVTSHASWTPDDKRCADVREFVETQRPAKLLVDVSDVGFCSECELHLLLTACKSLRDVGGQMKISGVNDELMEILRITRLESLLHLYRTEEDAIRAFAAPEDVDTWQITRPPIRPTPSKPTDTAMDNNGLQGTLSFGNRCKVVGIACGFLVAFVLCILLAVAYAAPATFLHTTAMAFAEGEILAGMGACAGLCFYLIGLPTGIVFCLLAAWQGVHGRRTVLTGWVLRQVSGEQVVSCLKEPTSGIQAGASGRTSLALPLGMFLVGTTVFVAGAVLTRVILPVRPVSVTLLVSGAGLAALGCRFSVQVLLHRYGAIRVPSWLGIAILISIVAVPGIVALISWLAIR